MICLVGKESGSDTWYVFITPQMILMSSQKWEQAVKGFPGGSDGKESACNAGDLDLIAGLRRFPWRMERLPTPVFRPGEFHGP